MINDDMTMEEIIAEMEREYGEEFNWRAIGLGQGSEYFVDELKKEVNESDGFLKNGVRAAAKCESEDNVLFCSKDGVWRIYHLTYSANNIKGYPKYIEFDSEKEAAEYIKNKFTKEYLRYGRN
ncbi:MAG: hypothetical protein IJ736_11010 [Firmicutes bacterium]|nr:hypothetical protein [Bacillota bacterium]